jgi:two-component system, OmpR family, response regulator
MQQRGYDEQDQYQALYHGAGRDQPRPRILLVEDDSEIGNDTAAELEGKGFEVTWRDSAESALQDMKSRSFDLLLVDRSLPGIDGLSLIRQLRESNDRTAVIIISAFGEIDDRVRGLQAGGDDYMTKPFALAELTARVQAQLRRPYEGRQTMLREGCLEVDLVERTVTSGGHKVDLLPREFALLVYFMRRPGQLVTRGMLLQDVWHYQFLPQTNLVDVHLGKLRRKIDAPDGPSFIRNVRGAGFIFSAP